MEPQITGKKMGTSPPGAEMNSIELKEILKKNE
jgi:hypothetical protein